MVPDSCRFSPNHRYRSWTTNREQASRIRRGMIRTSASHQPRWTNARAYLEDGARFRLGRVTRNQNDARELRRANVSRDHRLAKVLRSANPSVGTKTKGRRWKQADDRSSPTLVFRGRGWKGEDNALQGGSDSRRAYAAAFTTFTSDRCCVCETSTRSTTATPAMTCGNQTFTPSFE